MNYRINNLHRPIDSKPEAYEAEIEKITGLKAGDYTWRRHRAVSYTHLTLPTSDLV